MKQRVGVGWGLASAAQSTHRTLRHLNKFNLGSAGRNRKNMETGRKKDTGIPPPCGMRGDETENLSIVWELETKAVQIQVGMTR